MSAFSSGEILWRIKKSDLNNHSPPFSENIFTGAPLPLSYESYTKKKKKHELCVCVCVCDERGGGIWFVSAGRSNPLRGAQPIMSVQETIPSSTNILH